MYTFNRVKVGFQLIAVFVCGPEDPIGSFHMMSGVINEPCITVDVLLLSFTQSLETKCKKDPPLVSTLMYVNIYDTYNI